jgi:hypothetical protein
VVPHPQRAIESAQFLFSDDSDGHGIGCAAQISMQSNERIAFFISAIAESGMVLNGGRDFLSVS